MKFHLYRFMAALRRFFTAVKVASLAVYALLVLIACGTYIFNHPPHEIITTLWQLMFVGCILIISYFAEKKILRWWAMIDAIDKVKKYAKDFDKEFTDAMKKK